MADDSLTAKEYIESLEDFTITILSDLVLERGYYMDAGDMMSLAQELGLVEGQDDINKMYEFCERLKKHHHRTLYPPKN